MIAAREAHLWQRIPLAGEPGRGAPSTREVIAEMVSKGLISSPKQAWRTLEKWARNGWYDYGVTLDLGWKTGNGAPPGATA